MRILSALQLRRGLLVACGSAILCGIALRAEAHDISISAAQLGRDVQRISDTLRFYKERDNAATAPRTAAEHRRALGAAEITLSLGDTSGALQILIGRLADENFHALPEYVDTLLMTSEILETQAQDVGAMLYAEQALRAGGGPEQMAEAGARWFRLARRNQRTDRVIEILNLWQAKGGAEAAGTEIAAQVMYQAAFAMRESGRRAEARAYLSRVPSNSAYGSRAAYLAGVLFVEDGDLAQAERWFAAVRDWAIISEEGSHQYAVEQQLRELASLSTARLLYERGDLAAADQAYARIPEGSAFQREACWERAYLALERKKTRAALKRLQCVVDLGARGSRAVDAGLFKASLLAHMTQYDQSIAAYERLFAETVEERDLFVQAMANLGERPAHFLFDGMERTALDDGEATASPGPATLLADSWTPALDQAYRIDRGIAHAGSELKVLLTEIQRLVSVVRDESTFGGLELRKKSLEVLLKEIRHLEGHARQGLEESLRSHASTGAAVQHQHGPEQQALKGYIQHLQVMGSSVESQIVAVDRNGLRRRSEALAMLGELQKELRGIDGALDQLAAAADVPVNGVARQALASVKDRLSDAAMRAEFGVLDTYWLKKQHRTRSVENLLQMKNETERQVLDAIEELSK